MNEPLATMAGSHEAPLVALSIAVAVFASFAALTIAARIWETNGRRRRMWIAAASLAMGGGIWSMHFIAMLALALPIPVHYDVVTTLASLAIAIAVTFFAFVLVADNRAWPRLVEAGAALGFGIAAMHYTGMAAMRMAGHQEHDLAIVAVSIAIAIATATLALWIATRGGNAAWRIGAATVMGAAVSGMHYTASAAVCFTASGAAPAFAGMEFHDAALASIVTGLTLFMLGAGILSVFVDRRFAMYRHRAEQAVTIGAERLRLLVQSSNDLIIVADPAGRITFAAPSSTRAIKRAPEELEGRSVFDFFDGPGADDLCRQLVSSAGLGKPIGSGAPQIIEGLNIDVEGRNRVFEATVCPLLDQPAVRGIVLTFHDVTERERATQDLARAKALADEANRMKSQFIAAMSHELRTPLNAVIGFSELMIGELFGPLGSPRYASYAADIKSSGEHLLGLINDILDISKIEAGEMALMEDVHGLSAIVAESLAMAAPVAAKRSIAVSAQDDSSYELLVDGRRIRQILLNLLSNAIKFSPEGGAVRVGWTAAAGGGLTINVEDSGIGIPDDMLDKVFTPFFQVDGTLARKYDGAGLGLAIARALAALHRGTLTLANRADGGVRATLALPQWRVRRRDAARPAADAAAAE